MSESKEEREIIFKEKEVVVATGEKVIVRQWSAYKFFKLAPRLVRVLEKVTGEKLRKVALEDPQKAFDELEDLIIGNVMQDLSGVLAVAAEEIYEIIKVTIDRDDKWMKTIPYEGLMPLADAVLSTCITKEVSKNAMTLLAKGIGGKKKKSSPSGK